MGSRFLLPFALSLLFPSYGHPYGITSPLPPHWPPFSFYLPPSTAFPERFPVHRAQPPHRRGTKSLILCSACHYGECLHYRNFSYIPSSLPFADPPFRGAYSSPPRQSLELTKDESKRHRSPPQYPPSSSFLRGSIPYFPGSLFRKRFNDYLCKCRRRPFLPFLSFSVTVWLFGHP